jgi:outer membrane protein assembly factor BamB
MARNPARTPRPVGWRAGGCLLAVAVLVFAAASQAGPRSSRPAGLRLTASTSGLPHVTTPADDWPSFGYGPGFTRDNQAERALSRQSVHNLELRWAFKSVPQNFSASWGFQGPVVTGGALYRQVIANPTGNAAHSDLEAINASTGTLEWGQHGSIADMGNQAVSGGMIFTPYSGPGCESDCLEALNANGTVAWTFPGGHVASLGLAAGDGVVYTTTPATAYALDAQTGQVLWQLAGDGFGQLALGNGVVYLTCAAGIEAVTAATGKVLWTSPDVAGDRWVAVSGGSVFAVGNVTVRELNAATGATVWRAKSGDGTVEGWDPAVDDNALYLSTTDGGLHAYSLKDGHALWSRPHLHATESSPAVADGVVYVGTDRAVLALSTATGAVLWRAVTGQVMNSPAIADGQLYIDNGAGVIDDYGLPGGTRG